MRLFIAALLTWVTATIAQAGEVTVQKAHVAESVGLAKSAAGFLTIRNHGAKQDRLIAVEADFPRVEIHLNQENDGVMRMVHQQNGVIVDGEHTVEFKPGGLHVMFMGLSKPFVAGDTFDAVLVFEIAGRIETEFVVVTRDELMQMDNHGHGDHGGTN